MSRVLYKYKYESLIDREGRLKEGDFCKVTMYGTILCNLLVRITKPPSGAFIQAIIVLSDDRVNDAIRIGNQILLSGADKFTKFELDGKTKTE